MPKHPVQNLEIIDFGTEDPIERDLWGATVCPFGPGDGGNPVCYSQGCQVCDDGVRCCSAGETCMLDGKENYCTSFRGVDGGDGVIGGGTMMPRFQRDVKSFWER